MTSSCAFTFSACASKTRAWAAAASFSAAAMAAWAFLISEDVNFSWLDVLTEDMGTSIFKLSAAASAIVQRGLSSCQRHFIIFRIDFDQCRTFLDPLVVLNVTFWTYPEMRALTG